MAIELFREFLKSKSGNVAMALGVSAIPLFAAIGAAVDYKKASDVRAVLQRSADAAALSAAAARSNADKSAEADEAFAANFGDGLGSNLLSKGLVTMALPNNAGKRFVYSARASAPSRFMQLVGFGAVDISVVAAANIEPGNMEVALVLDNTGSMGNFGRMASLKAAASSLIGTLSPAGVKIAIVPFDTQVSLDGVVGIGGGADTALNPFDSATDCATISDPADRYACENAVRNTGTPPAGWTSVAETAASATAGAVVTDTVTKIFSYPDGTAVKIVATSVDGGPAAIQTDFSPDGGGSWLSAQGPVSSKPNTNISANNDLLLSPGAPWYGCVIDREQPNDTTAAAPTAGNPATIYPKAACATPNLMPVMALSTNTSALLSHVAGMQPSGNTNVTIGVQWGMEALSASSPLTNAAAFGTPGLEKHMIVVTDGDNTQNRWTHDAGQIDLRTAGACANAKTLNIVVHTIRLQQGNAALLSSCASGAENFYDVSSASGLDDAFDKIIKKISKIHLTE